METSHSFPAQAGLREFAFHLYDLDGSGSIERFEVEAMVHELYGSTWKSSRLARDTLRKLGGRSTMSRRREDPKVDPISLALERGQEDIAESLLANLHPAPGPRTGPRRDDVTVLDARDDNFADMFWCCATNGLAGSGSSALRARHRDIAPYDFSPPPTSPPATPAKKKATSGFPFSPLGKRTPSSK